MAVALCQWLLPKRPPMRPDSMEYSTMKMPNTLNTMWLPTDLPKSVMYRGFLTTMYLLLSSFASSAGMYTPVES